MKRLLIVGALVGLVAVPITKAAEITAWQTSGASWGEGGELSAYGEPGNTELGFTGQYAKDGIGYQTFCIEVADEFSPGTYYNYTLGQTDHNGRPLTLGAAFLFSQFEQGSLPGYNYTYGGGREATAGELQAAIWYFQYDQSESYLPLGTPHNNPFTDYAINLLGAAAASGASGGAYDVEVLQLASGQDWLAVVPDPVPDGGSTLGLLGGAFMAVMALRRRLACSRLALCRLVLCKCARP